MTTQPTPASARRPRVPGFVPIFNPIARRLMRWGVPIGPNALLTVRGRRTGLLRTTPVAVVEVGGTRWIVGTFGEVSWVHNLRAAGEGVLAVGRRREQVRGRELTPGEVESFFADVLGPYIRSQRLGRWMIGSLLQAPDILDDPHGAAERHPVFELHAAG